MKASVYFTALCLAGLGLAAPAPVHNERGLQAERALPGFDVDARDVDFEKRASKPKTTKKTTPVVTTKKADPTTTKPATTTSKSSSTSSVASSTKTSSSIASTTSTTTSSSSSSVVSTTSTTASSTSTSSTASTSATTSGSTSVSTSGTVSGTTSGTTSGTVSATTSGTITSSLSTTASRNGTVTGKPSTTKLSSTITSSSSLTTTGNSTVTGKPSLTQLSSTITSSASLTTTGNSTVTGRKTDTLSTITSTRNSTLTGAQTSTTLLSSTTTANGTATSSMLSSTTAANGTATSSGAFCTRPTSTGKAGKVNARGEGDGAASGSSCGEEYIDFGNGWRTPITSEQSSAKVKTPTQNGGTQPARYRTMTDDFPKPPKEKNQWNKKVQPAHDCPADQNDVLTKQVDGHADTGAMITPPRDGVLFYSVVQATEHDWAAAESKGFYFMLDIVKDTWIDWVRFAMGCRQFWPIMSKATALLAQGDVHVLLPSKTFEVGEVPVWPKVDRDGKVGQRSVWDEHEWPTLLRENQGACRVWRWNKSTNQPDLLAVRTNGGCSGYPASPDGATKKTYSWDSNTLA